MTEPNGGRCEPSSRPPRRRRPPLQFGLRTMLAVTAVLGLVFAVLRWLEVPPQVSLLVLVLLGVSVIGAIALVVVIAAGMPDRRDQWQEGERRDETREKTQRGD